MGLVVVVASLVVMAGYPMDWILIQGMTMAVVPVDVGGRDMLDGSRAVVVLLHVAAAIMCVADVVAEWMGGVLRPLLP